MGWHRLYPWADSVGGLTRLKTKYIISPLSNGNVALLTEMAKFAGLPWNLIPSAELFEHPGGFSPIPHVASLIRAALEYDHPSSSRGDHI